MRLIDADLLAKEIEADEVAENIQALKSGKSFSKLGLLSSSNIRERIDKIPTAFDVDRVIEELDDASRCMTIEYSEHKEHLSAIDRIKAIEIVKRGGLK